MVREAVCSMISCAFSLIQWFKEMFVKTKNNFKDKERIKFAHICDKGIMHFINYFDLQNT
jgi:hypothetical protein